MGEVVSEDRTTRSNVSWQVSDDWLAAGLGLLILALVVAGVRFDLPKFAWANWGELSGNVLSGANLLKAAVSGLVFLGLSAGGGARL